MPKRTAPGTEAYRAKVRVYTRRAEVLIEAAKIIEQTAYGNTVDLHLALDLRKRAAAYLEAIGSRG